MSQRPLRVDYGILCDDIRREHNGKVLLIGVYTGAVLFEAFPAQTKVAVWLHGFAKSAGSYRVDVKVTSKSGKSKPMVATGHIDVFSQESDSEVFFGATNAPVKFQAPGVLLVHYRYSEDARWKLLLDKKVNVLSNAPPQPS